MDWTRARAGHRVPGFTRVDGGRRTKWAQTSPNAKSYIFRAGWQNVARPRACAGNHMTHDGLDDASSRFLTMVAPRRGPETKHEETLREFAEEHRARRCRAGVLRRPQRGHRRLHIIFHHELRARPDRLHVFSTATDISPSSAACRVASASGAAAATAAGESATEPEGGRQGQRGGARPTGDGGARAPRRWIRPRLRTIVRIQAGAHHSSPASLPSPAPTAALTMTLDDSRTSRTSRSYGARQIP